MTTHLVEVYEHTPDGLRLARVSGDAATGSALVDAAYDHATATVAYLDAKLGWHGWDGLGTPVKVIANAPGWTSWTHDKGTVNLSVHGDNGTTPTALGNDVVAHEIGHGVAVTRNPRIPGNSNLGQMLANTIAMAIDPDDWQLGEDVYATERVYDYLRPEKLSFSSDYGYAMALMGEAIGRDAMARVWFEVTPQLDPADTLAQTGTKVLETVRAIGLGEEAARDVSDAWRRVQERFPKS